MNKRKQISQLLLIITLILIVFLNLLYTINTENNFFQNSNLADEILLNQSVRTILYIVLIVLCLYALLFYMFIRDNKKNLKVETLFIIVASIFSILVTVAIPMSNGHDETIHAMRIYEYAEGKLISDGEKAHLEEGIINAITEKSFYSDIINPEKTYSTNTEEVSYGYRISTYSPVNYLPQIVGIKIGRIFTTNSMVHLYLARIFNIITCITILYFAIKVAPFGKNLLFILSCIPITIEGFSTLSADGLLIAISFFWISYILHLCNTTDKKIGKKQIAILLFSAITIALSKTIYIPLLLLLLLIPKEKWGNKKQCIITIISIIVLSSLLDIGWYFIGIQKTPLENGESAMSFIIKSPIAYIQKIIYSTFYYFEKYTNEIYGESIEWNEQTTIHLFPYILLIFSIIVSITGKETIKWKTSHKIIITLIILAVTFLVFTSMFLGCSKTDSRVIQGVQGRYFMPIIPLVFLLFGKKFIDTPQWAKRISMLVVIMQIYVVTTLFIHHI